MCGYIGYVSINSQVQKYFLKVISTVSFLKKIHFSSFKDKEFSNRGTHYQNTNLFYFCIIGDLVLQRSSWRLHSFERPPMEVALKLHPWRFLYNGHFYWKMSIIIWFLQRKLYAVKGRVAQVKSATLVMM